MPEPIGERVAVLRERLDNHDEAIESLVESRHEHANQIQRVLLACDIAGRDIVDLRETVIPEINRTMRQLAEEQVDIRAVLAANKNDFSWVLKILTFVMSGLVTPLALLWLGYLIAGK